MKLCFYKWNYVAIFVILKFIIMIQIIISPINVIMVITNLRTANFADRKFWFCRPDQNRLFCRRPEKISQIKMRTGPLFLLNCGIIFLIFFFDLFSTVCKLFMAILDIPNCGPEILRFRLTIIQFLRKGYILINAETLSRKSSLGMDNGRKLFWAIRN